MRMNRVRKNVSIQIKTVAIPTLPSYKFLQTCPLFVLMSWYPVGHYVTQPVSNKAYPLLQLLQFKVS